MSNRNDFACPAVHTAVYARDARPGARRRKVLSLTTSRLSSRAAQALVLPGAFARHKGNIIRVFEVCTFRRRLSGRRRVVGDAALQDSGEIGSEARYGGSVADFGRTRRFGRPRFTVQRDDGRRYHLLWLPARYSGADGASRRTSPSSERSSLAENGGLTS